MAYEFTLGDTVEFVGYRIESCGERDSDRAITLKERGNTVLVYHLTMEEDRGWCIHSRGDQREIQEWIARGLITEEESHRYRFWWYYKDEITKVSSRNTIIWID